MWYESIKHALCQDEILLKRLSRKGKSLGVISKLIEDTIKLKIRLFELDEKGVNESNIFIYGHEIGRVIESISKGKLTHGEAISIGMCCSARLSNSLGHLSDRDLIRHFTVLKKWGLPTRIPKISR